MRLDRFFRTSIYLSIAVERREMRYLMWVVVTVLMLVVTRISQRVEANVDTTPSLLSRSTAESF